MIKIRDPNLDLLAVLDNVLNPTIKEAINREFFLSFTTVDDGEKSQYIQPDNIVEVDDNYFVIVRLRRQMTQKGELMINVDCEHVNMYELNKPEYNIEYFTVYDTPTNILTQILAGTGFTVGTVDFPADMTLFSLQEPNTRRGLLVQFAEQLGGELKFDKYTVHLLQRRGADNGIQFRVGKNLRGITVDMDKRSGTLQTAFDVDVIELSQHPEFCDLEKFELGDTVRIIAPDLGIDEEQRIIEYEYDPILKMNSRVTIANFIEGLEDDITRIQRTTVVKERLYNGIRIGPQNGFEAIRSDNKARTVMNATTGITIQKGDGSGSSWSDVFYADLHGNLVLTGRIEAGEFVGGTIDIGSGAFTVDNTGNVTITTGSIDLGNGVFTVDNAGNFTATSATIEGTIQSSEFIGGTITGALIQTSVDIYPRIELSSTSQVLRAFSDANSELSIEAGYAGSPAIIFNESGDLSLLSMIGSDFLISTPSGTGGNIQVSAGSDLILDADQKIRALNGFYFKEVGSIGPTTPSGYNEGAVVWGTSEHGTAPHYYKNGKWYAISALEVTS